SEKRIIAPAAVAREISTPPVARTRTRKPTTAKTAASGISQVICRPHRGRPAGWFMSGNSSEELCSSTRYLNRTCHVAEARAEHYVSIAVTQLFCVRDAGAFFD